MQLSSTASYIIEDGDLPQTLDDEIDYSKIESLIESLSSDTKSSNSGPTIKWLNNSELFQLISYLNSQSKTTTTTSQFTSIIIDTRNSNEYNGWKSFNNIYSSIAFNQTGLLPLYDMKNGRLNDAHNLDADWLHIFDADTLRLVVAERYGLKPKNHDESSKTLSNPAVPIILYDTDRQRLEKVKNYLLDNFVCEQIYLCELKNEDLSTYMLTSNTTGNLFFQEPFYDMLMSPEVLNAILRPFNDTHVLNVKPITNYKLFDVSKGGPELHYENSHIPTAFHLNTDDLEDAKTSIRKNRTELAKVFLNYGILTNNTDMIILYGNPNPLASYRVAILMKWMGIRDVHVLNGGFRSWLIKSLPIETFPNKPTPVKTDLLEHIRLFEEQSYYAQTPINYIVDQNYVSDLVKNHEVFQEQYLLVDVRTYEEHIGEVSGIEGLNVKGRIPTSLWAKAGHTVDQLEEYRNPDLTMRSGVEILKMWDDLGIDYKSKNLIFYCSNGWRSAEVMYYAELMGLYKISLYDGGWIEWSSNPNNTIQYGPSNDSGSIQFETRFTDLTTEPTVTQESITTISQILTSISSTTIKQQIASNLTTNIQTTVSSTNKKMNLTTRTKTSLSPSDIYFKNQFDLVTANPNRASSKNYSRLVFVKIFILSILIKYFF